MDKRRKNSPIRFIKRNTLYILLILLICVLVAALVFMVWQIVKMVGPEETVPPVAEQEIVQPTEPAPKPEEPPAAQPEEAEPAEDVLSQLPGAFVPPFDGITKFLSNQKLALTYDGTKLQLAERDGLYTLTGLDGQALPRLDLESLPVSLDDLTEEERTELAVGLLQACYYVAPATADIACEVTELTENNVAMTLSAPAHLDAPAMKAKVRLMQVQDKFWYAIALIPEGADGAAVEQAIDHLTIR